MRSRRDVISGIFTSAAAAMIVTQLVSVAANMIDGIITSNFYGTDAYSAISLSSPIINTIVLVAAFVSTGVQISCSQSIGRGEAEEANGTFSLALVCGAVISAVFTCAALLFPEKLAALCGIKAEKYPAIYANMQEYLRGYLFGIPAMVFVQLLGPLVVMDNGKKRVAIAAVLLCVSDIAGDLLNALVFDGHNFGMGLATSISHWLNLLVLCGHYLKKRSFFHVDFKGMSFKSLFSVFKSGSPTFVRKFATVLRDLFVNRLNLVVALSVTAVAARSIQNDLNLFMFALGPGIGKVLVTMTGMYYSAGDRRGLTRLFSYSMKFSAALSATIGALSFIFAKGIVLIFTRDPSVLEYAVLSVRCMAVSLIFDTVACSLQNYLQGIQNLKLVNLMNFGERFFIPVATAAILGLLYGSKGVLVSMAVGKLILAVMMLVIVCVHNHHLPRETADFMFLPENFGGREEDNLYFRIESIEDVMEVCRQTDEFCRCREIDTAQRDRILLFVEELGTNVVRHGLPRSRSGLLAELRLYLSDGKMSMTWRDYCRAFDPVSYYRAHENDTEVEHYGIRIVMRTAEKVSYINAFNSNNTIVMASAAPTQLQGEQKDH